MGQQRSPKAITRSYCERDKPLIHWTQGNEQAAGRRDVGRLRQSRQDGRQ